MQADKGKSIIRTPPVANAEHKALFKDRKRTNFLRTAEQNALFYLVKRIPAFITPNILTCIGVFGSFLVLTGFVLATYVNNQLLLLGIVGLAINWFGDSLDGRIAYYRNIPRKWYGFSLDIIMDWLSVVLMGLGYLVYAKGLYELLAFSFVTFYGWAMIIAQLRFKITDKYTIDSGIIGPTELRVIISLILVLEFLFPGAINYCLILISSILLYINISDTNKLLDYGNAKDKTEKELKQSLDNERKEAV